MTVGLNIMAFLENYFQIFQAFLDIIISTIPIFMSPQQFYFLLYTDTMITNLLEEKKPHFYIVNHV